MPQHADNDEQQWPSNVFDAVFRSVAILHDRWRTFCDVFDHSEERIRLINRRNGRVFRTFRDVLLDAVVLDVCRLLDRQSVMKKETISLERAIVELSRPPQHPARLALEDELLLLRQLAERLISHRHQRVAHGAKAIALSKEVLPGITRSLITDVVAGIDALTVRVLETRTPGDSYKFDPFRRDDAGELFNVLREGNEALDRKRRRRREAILKQWGLKDPPGQRWDIGDWEVDAPPVSPPPA